MSNSTSAARTRPHASTEPSTPSTTSRAGRRRATSTILNHLQRLWRPCRPDRHPRRDQELHRRAPRRGKRPALPQRKGLRPGKLAAFRWSQDKHFSGLLGAKIGQLRDASGDPIMIVFDHGLYLPAHQEHILFKDITSVRSREDRAEDPKALLVNTTHKPLVLEVGTETGKFRDIFEVFRFLLRCAEDHGGIA